MGLFLLLTQLLTYFKHHTFLYQLSAIERWLIMSVSVCVTSFVTEVSQKVVDRSLQNL